jgi:alpha-galactosidase
MTPIETRAAVAFFGVFGYELDPTSLTAVERAAVTAQVSFYKEHRELFQRGRFIRLRSPFEEGGNRTAWMVVAPDRSRAIVGFFQALNVPVPVAERLRLRGLDPAARYQVSGWPWHDDPLVVNNAGLRGGDELMSVGLSLGADRHEAAAWGDFRAWLFVLEQVEA